MYSHRRILVALDGSAAAEAVLRFLLEVAGPMDITVLLVRVLEPIPPMVVEGVRHLVLEDVARRRRDAEEYLAPIASALRSQDVDVAWQVRRGRAADEILASAAESHVDLIAMATHGRTGLGRLLFGSVAETVLRRAPVPVLMIRQPDAVAEIASTTREAHAR
jgi:nucleotide-binding universal stress UspA family protein